MEQANQNIKNPEYKKDCGFRNHLNRCNFKVEDCNETECDMYPINWDKDSINKIISKEKDRLKNYKLFLKSEKDKKAKQKFEDYIKDILIGLCYMTEALFFIEKGYFLEFKKIKRIFGNTKKIIKIKND